MSESAEELRERLEVLSDQYGKVMAELDAARLELAQCQREMRAYHQLRRDAGELLRRLPVDLPVAANNMRLAVVADLNPRT